MLVVSIQKKFIAQKIMKGEYKANFWESDFSCLSPRYTRGYMKVKCELEEKSEVSLSDEDVPIWAWVGVPYKGFYDCKDKKDLVVLILDIPESRLVFSDYDKYCDYVEGNTNSLDFMVRTEDVKSLVDSGGCVQASFSEISSSDVLLALDLSEVIEEWYVKDQTSSWYWQLLLVYHYLRIASSRRMVA